MSVVVAVIAQHKDTVAPCSGIGSAHIVNYLVYLSTRLGRRAYGETSHAYVNLLSQETLALSVIQQSKVVLHHI